MSELPEVSKGHDGPTLKFNLKEEILRQTEITDKATLLKCGRCSLCGGKINKHSRNFCPPCFATF